VNSNHSETCQFEGDDDKFDPIKRAIEKLARDGIQNQEKIAADEGIHKLRGTRQYVNVNLRKSDIPRQSIYLSLSDLIDC